MVVTKRIRAMIPLARRKVRKLLATGIVIKNVMANGVTLLAMERRLLSLLSEKIIGLV